MRILHCMTFALTGIAFITCFLVFGRQGGIEGLFFFLPFTMVPFVVTAYFATLWRAFWSQAVVLAITAAYAAWFSYIYVQVTIQHPDPQSPIAFLFVGIYALPVLVPLWILAWGIDWERKDRWAV